MVCCNAREAQQLIYLFSHAATTEAMPGVSDNGGSQSLFDESEGMNQSYVASEASAMEYQSTDGCEPSTSGCSSSQSPQTILPERLGKKDSVGTTNFEATLDPATRLALIRKRKQRSTAAARLDNTLTGFVDWVKASDDRKESTLNSWNHQDMMFQKQVIDNLRVASDSLAKLTQFLTNQGTKKKVNMEGEKTHNEQHTKNQTEILVSNGSPNTDHVQNSDSDGDTTGTSGSETASEQESDTECSVSLLPSTSSASLVSIGKPKKGATVQGSKPGENILLGHKKKPMTSTQKQGAVEPHFPVSPYLIVKQESGTENIVPRNLTTPKRRRIKKKIFSP